MSNDDIEQPPQEQEQQQHDESELVCPEELFRMKWRALVLICFLTFGGYWIYDFPGSLGIGKAHSIESWFADHDKDFTSEKNQALYSIYSWPNTVAATFGGILIDNIIGLRKALLLFVCLVALGSAIFYFGVLGVNYPVMLLGRFVFGLGNESNKRLLPNTSVVSGVWLSLLVSSFLSPVSVPPSTFCSLHASPRLSTSRLLFLLVSLPAFSPSFLRSC
jgi:MFS family permease